MDSAILSISSHVMRGCVGNRACVFALETLGHSVWAVPTVVMPWHPGHGPSTRMSPDKAAFDGALADLTATKWRNELKAAITGYFANAEQVLAASRLISALRDNDPDFVFLCDPVIGDQGGLYVPIEVADAIREELLPISTIATPNRFELGWLSQMPVDDNHAIIAAAEAIASPEIIVTSAHAMMASAMANLYLNGGKAVLAEHRALSSPPNGLGDLLAALFLSHKLGGTGGEDALQRAVSSVYEIAARSVEAGSGELLLAREASALKRPLAMVSLRNFIASAKRRKVCARPGPDDDHSG